MRPQSQTALPCHPGLAALMLTSCPGSQVCLSAGIGNLLPSLIQSIFLSKLTAIVQIAIDEERNILYTRSQGSSSATPCIQVARLAPLDPLGPLLHHVLILP